MSALENFDSRAFLEDNGFELYESLSSDPEKGVQFVLDRCPFPDCEGHKKLYLAEQTGLWKCFKCERSGNLTRLLAEVLSLDEIQAGVFILTDEKYYREPSLDDVKKRIYRRPAPLVSGPVPLPEGTVPIFDEETGNWNLHPYLAARGISPKAAAYYKIGFCRRDPACAPPIYNRLILPSYVNGEVRYWVARSVVDDPNSPKYLNPAQGKGSSLFGYDQAVGADTVVLVEGSIDAIGCYSAGYRAMAILGKSATEEQLRLVRNIGAKTVVVLLDYGAKTEAARICERLEGHRFTVHLAQLPEFLSDGRKCDPGNAPKDWIQKAIGDGRPLTLADKISMNLVRARKT